MPNFSFSLALTGTITVHGSGPTPPTPPPWAGYTQWLRANDSPDGAIATLPDLSANHLDEVQATGGLQPTIVANVANGKKALRFVGTQFMACAALSVAQPNTIFIAFQMPDTTGIHMLMDGLTGRQDIWSQAGLINAFAGNVVAPGNSIGTAVRVVTVEFNGASSNIWMDGVLIAANVNLGTQGLISELLGKDNFGNFLNGDIFERIIYPSIGSSANRKANQQYLADEYGVTLGQPQITTIDYTGLSGANFVTGGAALYCTASADLNAPYYFWFNTGTESDPAPGGTGIQVVLSVLVTDAQIADAMRSAAGSIWSAGVSGAVTTLTNNLRETVTAATAATSGAVVTITQTGSGNS